MKFFFLLFRIMSSHWSAIMALFLSLPYCIHKVLLHGNAMLPFWKKTIIQSSSVTYVYLIAVCAFDYVDYIFGISA